MRHIKPRSAYRELPPLVVYLDQLEKALGELNRIKAVDVRVETGGFELEELPSELTELPFSESNHLRITAFEPYGLIIQLSGASGGHVLVDSGDLQAEGLADSLSKALMEGDRQPWILGKSFFWNLAGIPGVLLSVYFAITVSIAVGVFILVLYLIISAGIAYRETTRYKVYFRYQKEERSFWGRNRDKLYILVIGGLFGSGLTLLVKWLSNFLSSP